jgi:hypothetical protein
MKFFSAKQVLSFVAAALLLSSANAASSDRACTVVEALPNQATVQNNCVTFSVSSGTGCQWMCNYCASQLGTNNYYFTNGVCTYQPGGCVGNPQSGVSYTCCSA